MKQSFLPVFIVAATIMLGRPGFLQAQEKTTDVTGAPLQSQADSDIQWLWGEVSSVAAERNEAVVKYLDYEADVEKDMTVAVTDKTSYENIKGLGELKPQDTVSIDYVVVDGKSVAKNISVEKPEVMPAAETPAAAPMAVPPAAPAEVVPPVVEPVASEPAAVPVAAPVLGDLPVVEPAPSANVTQ